MLPCLLPSWTWRKLLNLMNTIHHFIQHIIGNGRDTFLWFDYWLPLGPIHSQFGDRVIYDSGLPRYARVSDIIDGENWHWPIANSPDLSILKNSIPNFLVPSPTTMDGVIWRVSSTGSFSIKEAYQNLAPNGNKVEWHRLVWYPQFIPKASFILWLAIKCRLGTQDWLHISSTNPKCLLCNLQLETHNHLFSLVQSLALFGVKCFTNVMTPITTPLGKSIFHGLLVIRKGNHL